MNSANGIGPCSRDALRSRCARRGTSAATRGRLHCVLPLRVACEHLDHVVVQAVVELPLKCPGKLRVFDFARLQEKLVGVHFHSRGLEANLDGDAVRPRPASKSKSGCSYRASSRRTFSRRSLRGVLRAVRGDTAARSGRLRPAGGSASSPRSFISRMAFSNAASALASKSTK